MSLSIPPVIGFRRQVSASLTFTSKTKRLKRIRVNTQATSNFTAGGEYMICGLGDVPPQIVTIRSANPCARKTVVTNVGANPANLYEGSRLVSVLLPKESWVSFGTGNDTLSSSSELGTSLSVATYVLSECSAYSGSGGIDGGFEL